MSNASGLLLASCCVGNGVKSWRERERKFPFGSVGRVDKRGEDGKSE